MESEHTIVALTLAEAEALVTALSTCTRELDCPCPACDAARQARVARGARPRNADQPWRTR
ncbi:MAG: hypothetical protein JWM93_1397 [Frankiales bacterium]|jgi:hypothetical protein|nr:hypothetical protein [Frankiales bacterium]